MAASETLVSPGFPFCLLCLDFIEVGSQVPGEYKQETELRVLEYHTFPSPCPPHRWATGPWAGQSSASRSARRAGCGRHVRQGGPAMGRCWCDGISRKNNCLEMHLRQSGERLLHFGSLLQGIVVVKTKLVEPRSTESKIFSLWFQLQSECSVMKIVVSLT